MTSECGTFRVALGAYVVGALEPAERAEVEEHLAACPPCREELAALAGLPGLLGRLDEETAVSADHQEVSSATLERTVEELRLRRRRARRRSRIISLAAAVAVVASAGGAVAATSGSSPQPQATGAAAGHLAGSDASTGVQATAALYWEPWGSQIRMVVSGVSPGHHCRLLAVSTSGRSQVIGTWNVTYGGKVDIAVATSISPARLASLRVVTTSGAVLLSLTSTGAHPPSPQGG